MGGGGMGRLERNEKYILILEVLGPRTKNQATDFNKDMAALMRKFKVTRRRYSYRAVKDVKDQRRRGGG